MIVFYIAINREARRIELKQIKHLSAGIPSRGLFYAFRNMGQGEGEGHGAGEGGGQDTAQNVGMGCGVIAVVGCVFYFTGLPLMLYGAIALSNTDPGSGTHIAGLICVILASLLAAGGIVAGVLICAGVCENKQRRVPVRPIITVSSSQSQAYGTGMYSQPPPYQGPSYPGQPYPGQQQYGAYPSTSFPDPPPYYPPTK